MAPEPGQEPATGGVGIRDTGLRPRAVLATVAQNVAHGAPYLPDVLQRQGEVAIGEHRALPSAPQGVERLRYSDLEALHAAGESCLALGLDHEVHVVLLNAVVEEREARRLLALAERALESTQGARSTETRQSSVDPQYDVQRPANLRAQLVRHSRPPAH